MDRFAGAVGMAHCGLDAGVETWGLEKGGLPKGHPFEFLSFPIAETRM
ncbi:hypothetical protein CA13_07100 [Planctomycetes bacterium CA13]|uniref:Uncharacterized protein n=1 Tax=Novipirellula herctigrandis TaxID=2527986 RepID=A0A5C5YX78_9BACT|nr:hypothetical protein CA13_07100 [Planctomycetes bacterium CA13]